MKKYLFLFILVSISFISCKSSGDNPNKPDISDKSNKLVEKFYKAYNDSDNEQIADICDGSISAQVKKIASDNFDYLGKNISHEQYSSKNIKKGGQKTKILTYKSQYEKFEDVIYEKFFIDLETNKISSYVYSGNKEFIDNYENYSIKASDLTFKYYDDLIKGDLSGLSDILDQKTKFGKSITEKYIQVIKDRQKNYGKIKSYSQLNIKTYIDKGLVTIIQRFECETDQNEKVYEELWLVELNGEFKIFDYYYAPDYKTLISNE